MSKMCIELPPIAVRRPATITAIIILFLNFSFTHVGLALSSILMKWNSPISQLKARAFSSQTVASDGLSYILLLHCLTHSSVFQPNILVFIHLALFSSLPHTLPLSLCLFFSPQSLPLFPFLSGCPLSVFFFSVSFLCLAPYYSEIPTRTAGTAKETPASCAAAVASSNWWAWLAHF